MTLRLIILAAIMLALTVSAHAQGDSQSRPAGTDPMALKPGQFVWTPEVAPEGPLVIVISLPQQRAYVYRNGVEIGVTTVSTGRKGFETPTGVFRVLEKDIDHRSNLYNDAPMPFMLRLTWGGVALHAGYDPGRPQSHGCVRLPLAFARSLFETVPLGSQVIVTDRKVSPGFRIVPDMFMPGQPLDLVPGAADHWSPERALAGPVTLVLSGADKALSVIRGGVEIGRTRVKIVGHAPLHTHALVLMEKRAGSDTASGDWMLIDLPGDAGLPKERRHSHDIDRIRMPPDFAASLATILKPGSTILISDLPLGVADAAELRVFGVQE